MNVADLMAKLEELVARIEKLERERDEYHRLYLDALEKNRKLELGLLGQKAERVPANDAQLTLQLLSTLLGEEDTKPEPESEPKPRPEQSRERNKPTGRKPLPENLPRIEIELIPEEVQRLGRDAFDVIGQEVRETVERRPSSLVVVRTIRPKFVPKDRHEQGKTKVHIAAPLELPIERGLAGPGG